MRYRTKLLNNKHKKDKKLFIIGAALLIISTTVVVKVNPELLVLIKQATPVHLEKQSVYAKTEPLHLAQNDFTLIEADSFEDYSIEYKEENVAVEVEKKPAEITEEELLVLVKKLEDTYFEKKEKKHQVKEDIQTQLVLPKPEWVASNTPELPVLTIPALPTSATSELPVSTTPELPVSTSIVAKAEPKPATKIIAPITIAQNNIAKRKTDKIKNAYTLQFASFIQIKNAKKVANKLIKRGFPAYIQQGLIEGKKWFRVRVGKFNSQISAKENAILIANMTGNKSYIAHYIDIPSVQ